MRPKINRWLQLVADCLVNLSKNNVKVIFTHTPAYIEEEKIYSAGYWDDSNNKQPVLACQVTSKEQDWVPIFAHEYCHFQQWVDQCDSWKAARHVKGDVMESILHNKPVSEKILNSSLDAVRDLELDCEKRTVQLFKYYKVPINVREYIKRANCYIHFYNHIKDYRKWYEQDNKPYQNSKLLLMSSSKFYKNYDDIPSKLKSVFKEIYPITKKSKLL